MARCIDIEGIGETYAQRLKSAGIITTEQLLQRGGTPAGRQEIAESVDVSTQRVLEWVNRADLFRIKGVSEEYSDLLEAAGVDTVPELARRNSDNLYQRLIETNQEKKLVRRLPGLSQVASWIEQAGALPRAIEY